MRYFAVSMITDTHSQSSICYAYVEGLGNTAYQEICAGATFHGTGCLLFRRKLVVLFFAASPHGDRTHIRVLYRGGGPVISSLPTCKSPLQSLHVLLYYL